MMPPKKLKNGKDIKMVQIAKNCNEEELAHALHDAIASSGPEVKVRPRKPSRVDFPEISGDDYSSESSRVSSFDFSNSYTPEPTDGRHKRQRRHSRASPSRYSSQERRSSRRKARKVSPAKSTSENSSGNSFSEYTSEDEDLYRKSRNRRRSSHSGRSRRTSQQSSKYLARDRKLKRMPRPKKVTHTRKRTPPPRSPDRSNNTILEMSSSSQAQMPLSQSQSMGLTSAVRTSPQNEGHVAVDGSKSTPRNEQDPAGPTKNSSQKRIPEASISSQKRTHQVGNSATRGSRNPKQKQMSETGAGVGIINEISPLRVPEPAIPELDDPEPGNRNELQILKNRVAALQKQIKKLEKAKAESDDHALELSKQLEAFKGGDAFARVQFTEVDEFDITTDVMDQLSDRASSDSMFVGLLLMAILGPERLQNMSATGQRSRRFSKKVNADGKPAYPAMEAVSKNLMAFLCDKVAERNQMHLGPSKIASIRAACTEMKIRRYVTQKLANHKRAVRVRTQQNEQQLADFE